MTAVLTRPDRTRPPLVSDAELERALRELLPDPVKDVIARGDVRTMTCRSPWSLHICDGRKPVENRPKNIAGEWRGRLLVHTGLQHDHAGAAWAARLLGVDPPTPAACSPGHWIGAVDLVDAHPADGQCCGPWSRPDGCHLVLRNPTRFRRPIPGSGSLGLRRVTDPELIAAALHGH
ncbi:hypothetical protein [Saccharothrix sp. HUAS TT1]|uniref:hypothetical protein n=1 Tax=unclassified Saccharothrix TaxID=2593673 RepID=UPI00345C2D31